MRPIYEPKGKAKEYGDLALNIYTGCPHGCFYCFAPNVLHRDRQAFHNTVAPRENIVEETKRQIEREGIAGRLIHLCFTCDPYPTGYDTGATREIIKVLKASGNHVQILTKGDGSRDFDLLDGNDWYGATIDGSESDEKMHEISTRFIQAKSLYGIKVWVSFEPVINAGVVLACIRNGGAAFDKVKIGKLNYHKSDINWKEFGNEAEALCREVGVDYYIKESLRAEMGR